MRHGVWYNEAELQPSLFQLIKGWKVIEDSQFFAQLADCVSFFSAATVLSFWCTSVDRMKTFQSKVSFVIVERQR